MVAVRTQPVRATSAVALQDRGFDVPHDKRKLFAAPYRSRLSFDAHTLRFIA